MSHKWARSENYILFYYYRRPSHSAINSVLSFTFSNLVWIDVLVIVISPEDITKTIYLLLGIKY